MGRRAAAGLWVLALALTACSEPAGRTPVDRTEAALTAGATLPPPVQEADAPDPVPAALPPPEVPAAVLSAGGIVVPVLGRDGEALKVSTRAGGRRW